MSTHIGADDDTTPKTIEWHPALGAMIRERPVLAEAMMNDGQLVHHLQLLSLFLTSLDNRIGVRDLSMFTGGNPGILITAALVADLVPSDQELIEQATRQAAAIRALEEGAYTTVDALATLLGQPVATPDEVTAGTYSDRPITPAAPLDVVRAVGPSDHPRESLPEYDAETAHERRTPLPHVTCHIDTLGHHGVHRQTDQCIMPVTA